MKHGEAEERNQDDPVQASHLFVDPGEDVKQNDEDAEERKDKKIPLIPGEKRRRFFGREITHSFPAEIILTKMR